MNVPTWETNSTDISRTNAIMKTIAGLFVGNTNVVPTIEPLNECVNFSIFHARFIHSYAFRL